MAAEDSQAEELTPMQMAIQQSTVMLQKEAGIVPTEEKKEATTEAPPKPEAETKTEAKEEDKPQLQEIKKWKVKVKAEDGSDIEDEVDEDTLIKGYMMEKSYRQKTAQLARQREEVQAEAKKSVETKMKEYDERLLMADQVIRSTLTPEFSQIDWNKLAAENPAEWAQKYQHAQNVNARLAQIQAERQRISTESQKQAQETQQKQAREAIDVLQTKVPGWNNDLYGKILKAAVNEYGFKNEEVGAITDPRAIEVLNDARQWREFKSAKPVVDKRVADKPKAVIKPGAANEKPDPAITDKWKQGMAQLKKTGSRADAVTLATLMLEQEGMR